MAHGASASALLRNLNADLDRQKEHTADDRLLSKMERSVRCRLGPRSNGEYVQDLYSRAGPDLCGAIFMCNRKTWKECLGQSLFGLPAGKKSLVDQVTPGMKLFLFEYERRQLWGVFEAISHGGIDIIPNAYTGGSFPCQVRVKVPEDCVALNEAEFCHTLKDNYFCAGKFHFNLTAKQVCHLITLFEKKYLRASGVEPALLEYEHRPRITGPMQPLLLTNGETCTNWVVDDTLSNSQAFISQLAQEEPILNSEESVSFVYRNITNFASEVSHTRTGANTLVPLSNSNGDFGTGELIPVYRTLTKQELIETLIIPRHGAQLHSDRPNENSIWSRISRNVKPLALTGTSDKQAKTWSSCLDAITPEQPVESTLSVSSSSPLQEACMADVIENAVAAAEEFLVRFKRRRDIGKDALVDVSEPRASKRRRMLKRPSFENENISHQKPTNLDLNLPLAPGFLNSDKEIEQLEESVSSERIEQRQNALALSLCPQSKDLLPMPEREEVSMNIGNEHQALHLYQTAAMERMSCFNDARIDFVDLTRQVEMVHEEHFQLGKAPSDKEQKFDSMSHTIADCTYVEPTPSDCTRVNILNEAPCTPAKEVAGCSGPAVDSETSLSPVDLKSILSGLQVSGIKLKLGPSPCLILQLDDSISRIDDQDEA